MWNLPVNLSKMVNIGKKCLGVIFIQFSNKSYGPSFVPSLTLLWFMKCSNVVWILFSF